MLNRTRSDTTADSGIALTVAEDFANRTAVATAGSNIAAGLPARTGMGIARTVHYSFEVETLAVRCTVGKDFVLAAAG